MLEPGMSACTVFWLVWPVLRGKNDGMYVYKEPALEIYEGARKTSCCGGKMFRFLERLVTCWC